ncbi:hypothetical protein BC829DRAFT_491107 [Chytridium lagenaria]|nr:hypothetical protein BC829DRAFT_491107 [Chytridium lagenaria]
MSSPAVSPSHWHQLPTSPLSHHPHYSTTPSPRKRRYDTESLWGDETSAKRHRGISEFFEQPPQPDPIRPIRRKRESDSDDDCTRKRVREEVVDITLDLHPVELDAKSGAVIRVGKREEWNGVGDELGGNGEGFVVVDALRRSLEGVGLRSGLPCGAYPDGRGQIVLWRPEGRWDVGKEEEEDRGVVDAGDRIVEISQEEEEGGDMMDLD